MEIRATLAGDLPAQYGVFRAAIGELFHRHRFAPPDPPYATFSAQHAHLLEHDAERCAVADDGGRVVGYAAGLARGDAWHLASLFVLPEYQSRGVGGALLDRVWGGPYERRLTLTDSIQPVSNGLYGRAGLIPTTPVLGFVGQAALRARPALEATPCAAATLAELDREAYGFDRAPDHAFWSRRAHCTVWRRGDDAVAYSYAWPDGRIGPLAGRDEESAAAALRAELASEAPSRFLLVPGSSAALVESALAAGLRLVAPPGLLLLSRGAESPRSLALSSYTLL
ncbi:MAG: GNAT family N-acetyltransferase [Gaiellaceae bacterium]